MKKLISKLCLILLAITCVFIGCKKNDHLADLGGARSVIKTNNIINLRSADDGSNELLAYGYDITGEFANSSAANSLLLIYKGSK